jgi:SAM-dependent methyltransferase
VNEIKENEYSKTPIYHLYDSKEAHWKMITAATEELARRYPLSGPAYEDGAWLNRVEESTPLSQRANKAMFNVAIDFFGDDLYKDEYGLEFSCGQGWATTYLSGYKPMIALDANEQMSGLIPRGVSKGINNILADAQFMPFLDNSIGLVFSCAAIHHIHDRAMGVREIHRILKPGGKYCGFGDLWTCETEMQRFRDNPIQRSADHPEGFDILIEGNPYGKEELYSWFNIGFSKVHIQTIKYSPHMHEFGYLNIACTEEESSNLIVMGVK